MVDYSEFIATNCTFVNNQAGLQGGAIIVDLSEFTAKGCTFDRNKAELGGAVSVNNSAITAENCTFHGNEAEIYGGAFNVGNSPFAAVNCTFNDNTAKIAGQTAYLQNTGDSFTAANCIFWGDDEKKQIDWDGTFNTDDIRIANCIIRGGYDPNDGNVSDIIDKDPMLKPLADNGGPAKTTALKAGSPAIDAGIDVFAGVVIPGEDQRGISRPKGNGYDIGAYESKYSKGASGASGGGCSAAGVAPSALLLLLPLAALVLRRR